MTPVSSARAVNPRTSLAAILRSLYQDMRCLRVRSVTRSEGGGSARDERRQIQDQRHRPVAEDGGARKSFHSAIHLAERLDDGLVLSDHPVDHEAAAALRVADDGDLLPV